MFTSRDLWLAAWLLNAGCHPKPSNIDDCAAKAIELVSIDTDKKGSLFEASDIESWCRNNTYMYHNHEIREIIRDTKTLEQSGLAINMIHLRKHGHFDFIEEGGWRSCTAHKALEAIESSIEKASGISVSPRTVEALLLAGILPVVSSEATPAEQIPLRKPYFHSGLVLGEESTVSSMVLPKSNGALRQCKAALSASIADWCDINKTDKKLCGDVRHSDDTAFTTKISLFPHRALVLIAIFTAQSGDITVDIRLNHSTIEDGLELRKSYDLKDLSNRIEESMQCSSRKSRSTDSAFR